MYLDFLDGMNIRILQLYESDDFDPMQTFFGSHQVILLAEFLWKKGCLQLERIIKEQCLLGVLSILETQDFLRV